MGHYNIKRILLPSLVLLLLLLLVNTVNASTFSIPSTKLSTALSLFALQSGLEVIYAPQIVRNKKSVAVNGNDSVENTLQRLLAGTGLDFRLSRQGTVLIEQATNINTGN